jgi:hypothetical protein
MVDKVILVSLKTSMLLDIPSTDEGIMDAKAKIELWEVSMRNSWVVLGFGLGTDLWYSSRWCSKNRCRRCLLSSRRWRWSSRSGGLESTRSQCNLCCGMNGRKRWCAIRKLQQL